MQNGAKRSKTERNEAERWKTVEIRRGTTKNGRNPALGLPLATLSAMDALAAAVPTSVLSPFCAGRTGRRRMEAPCRVCGVVGGGGGAGTQECSQLPSRDCQNAPESGLAHEGTHLETCLFCLQTGHQEWVQARPNAETLSCLSASRRGWVPVSEPTEPSETLPVHFQAKMAWVPSEEPA